MSSNFSAEVLDILLALILFLFGLGYSVSGLPASVVVGCVIWAFAWDCLTHLFFIFEGTSICPGVVKAIIWGAITFLVIIFLWNPVRVQYAKEHAPQSAPVNTPGASENSAATPAPGPKAPNPHGPKVGSSNDRGIGPHRADLHFVSVQLFRDGAALKARCRFQNTGESDVEPNTLAMCSVQLHEAFNTQKEEDSLFHGIRGTGRLVNGNYIRVSESFIVEGEYEWAVSPVEIEQIKRGNLRVYVISLIQFTDHTGDLGYSTSCHFFTGMDFLNEKELEEAESQFCRDHNPTTSFSAGKGKALRSFPPPS